MALSVWGIINGLVKHLDSRGKIMRIITDAEAPYTTHSSCFAEQNHGIGRAGQCSWIREVAYWKAIRAMNTAPMQKEAWGRWVLWQTMNAHCEKKPMMLYRKKAFGREYAKAAPCRPKYFDRIPSRYAWAGAAPAISSSSWRWMRSTEVKKLREARLPEM